MRAWLFYLGLLFPAPILLGQGLQWSGYYEPQFAGMSVKGDYLQLASNKLRVDLKADLGDKVSFGANFDYITYHGKTEWDVLDYLPESISSLVPPTRQSFYKLRFGDLAQMVGPFPVARPDRIFLDNAYVHLSFKFFDMTIGRQQISMGTGYAWNPTDVFNTKDLLDPTYEQPGHNAIRIDIPISSTGSIVAYYAPAEKWKDSGKMVKIKSHLGHFDYSLLAIEKYWTFTDYSSFEPMLHRRQVLGGDFAGELFGLGVWGEFGYNNLTPIAKYEEKFADYWESVVGIDYTFDSGTYVMVEFYRNTSGKADWQKYNLNDWMRLLSQESRALGRDQLYGFLQHPVTDLISLGCMSIFSISDNSLALVPTMSYSLFQDVELTLFGNFNLAKAGKTYGKNLGQGGIARLRVYF